MLIAYVMLIGPGFEQLSHASTTYSALIPDDWAKVGNSVIYTYDDIGRLTNKDTSGVETETVTYEYNNLDRLAKIITSRGDTVEVVEYSYNPDGIRVKSQFTRTINSVTDEVRTATYLVDLFNHTGYAQTIEEHRETTNYEGGLPETPVITDTTYTLGDDVISQYEASVGAEHLLYHLLYDGHGSTRQLTDDDITNVVVDCYGYDAYGVMLGGNPNHSAPAATSLLYAGEHFDADSQNYYLRARWYDSLSGRFNRLDPFAGNNVDPQSLHKYNYTSCNPINAIDPSGLDWFFANLGKAAHREIRKRYKNEHIGTIITGQSIPGLAGALFPDIMDFALKEIAEIKPLSQYGLSTGPIQLLTYLYWANKLGVPGAVEKPWTPSTWAVGVRHVPIPKYPNHFVVTIGNAYGLIFYKAFRIPKTQFKIFLNAAFIATLAKLLENVTQQLKATARQGVGAVEGVVAYLDYASEVAFRTAAARNMAFAGVSLITVAIIARMAMIQLQLTFVRT